MDCYFLIQRGIIPIKRKGKKKKNTNLKRIQIKDIFQLKIRIKSGNVYCAESIKNLYPGVLKSSAVLKLS